MKIKKPELVIDPKNPFSVDQLNRKDNAAILTSLIGSIAEPYVLGIDGGWGMGKSTFLDMWRYSLINSGYTCLYFNAWENDYASDPMISFIGEMSNSIRQTSVNGKDTNKALEYLDKIKNISKSIIARMMPASAKLITVGLVDVDDIYESILSDSIGSIVEDEINNYERNKTTLKSFRDSVSDFANAISIDDSKPVIFFIDELDRCRPTFAIELLERLKHLFNVNGIIYVIAMDRVQIGHSIRSQYGVGFDSEGYLRRFFDLEYMLPDPPKEAYVNYLFDSFEMFEELDNSKIRKSLIINMFSRMSTIYKLSLRDMGQCFTQLSLAILATPKSENMHEVFISLLIVLRKGNRDLYEEYSQNRVDGEVVLKDIMKDKIGEDLILRSEYGGLIEAYLAIAHCKDEAQFNYVVHGIVDMANNGLDSEKHRASRILKYTDQFRRSNNILGDVHSRIEVTKNFV